MGQLVNVSNAARKLGISRVKLQRLIQSGDLQTFEGQVDYDVLKRLFPILAIKSQSIVEDTKIIRDSAYAKRIHEQVQTTQEDLEFQLKRLRVELTIAKVKAAESNSIMREFVTYLSSLQETATAEEKKLIADLSGWLNQRINSYKQ